MCGEISTFNEKTKRHSPSSCIYCPHHSLPLDKEGQFLYFLHFRMSSSLLYQLPSSHGSSATSTRNQRTSSTDKLGLAKRTSSTSSLHRSTSNKSNSSIGAISKGNK